jgi:hypothetical protein
MSENQDNYWLAKAVTERIFEEWKSQGRSLASGGKNFQMKYYKGQNFKLCEVLLRAQDLNLSVKYLLDGQKKEAFKGVLIDYSRMREFKQAKPLGNRLTVARWVAERGKKKSLDLLTAFEIAEKYNMSVYQLFFREM